MMLWPVKFNTSIDPGTSQSNQCRFYNLVIIDKITVPDLVIGPVYTATELRNYHDLQIIVFQKQSSICFVFFFIFDLLNNCMRINGSATALVNSLLQKNWIFFRSTNIIGR